MNWPTPAGKPELGPGKDAGTLADVVEQRDFVRLVAALIRTSLAKDYDIIDRASALAAKAS